MKGIKVDYSQLIKFQKKIEKLSKNDTEQLMTECANLLANELLSKVKRRTPVDTGILRNNWAIGVITKEGSTYKIDVMNDTSYANYVEFGHRILNKNHKVIGTTKGVHMLEISKNELEVIKPEILKRKIYNYLRGIL